MPRSQRRGLHGQSGYLRLSFVHKPGIVQEDDSQGGEMTKKVVRGGSSSDRRPRAGREMRQLAT
jgi:hypothetical protein